MQLLIKCVLGAILGFLILITANANALDLLPVSLSSQQKIVLRS